MRKESPVNSGTSSSGEVRQNQAAGGLGKMLVCLLLCALAAACSPGYQYQTPPQTGDGWLTASLEDVGMDQAPLLEMMDRMEDQTYRDVHGVVIVKDGRLVFETYLEGYAFSYDPARDYQGRRVAHDADTLHNLASITKAVTSALVGIAIDRGLIASVDEPLAGFLPEYAHLFDEEKTRITLRHLLTMSSGLQWNEGQVGYGDSRNDLIRLFSEPDPVEYILSRPLIHEPGTIYYYSGGDVNLLGEVIKKVSGQRMDAFADEHLFVPLGITRYQWDFINVNVVHASGNLQLRPRDVAKFGELYLDGGTWRGQQVISKEWVQESTQGHLDMPGGEVGDQYGYQWHLKQYRVGAESIRAYCKEGWGGQRVTVFPDLALVVVFTGGSYVGRDPVDDLTTRYILPSALSTAAVFSTAAVR
ncbi:MAG: serine hydrolase [Anaerolineae bacterium]|nr:serine hydrolase [Anaerolineae bacterium]